MCSKPVVTYKRKQRADDWSAISVVTDVGVEPSQSPSPTPTLAMKPAPKKAAPRAGQASILTFVGMHDSDVFDFGKSTKKKPAASSASGTEAKQLFLDFGQRNLGTQVCPECSLTYSPGVVRLHNLSKDLWVTWRFSGGGRGYARQVSP